MESREERRWVSKKEAYSRTLKYMSARRSGEIKSLKCSLSKLNSAILDGFEFGLVVAWAARPATGKSVIKEQLIREFFELNPQAKFRVLDFDLEMTLISTALREFSAKTDKSYKALCSAEGETLSVEDYMKCYEYAKLKVELKAGNDDYPIDVVENAPTVKEFVEIIESYMETYCRKEGVTDKDGNTTEQAIYMDTVVSLDHCRLIKRAYQGQSEPDMLYELSAALIYLKKKYPILFLLLNHLGRTFVDHSRCEDGKNSNYPVDSDVHGSDALSQATDILFAMDRPAKRRIKYFGPERFIIDDDSVMMFTFLKVRNGDTRSSFFRAEFDKMRIVEMDTPACAKKVSKIDGERNE